TGCCAHIEDSLGRLDRSHYQLEELCLSSEDRTPVNREDTEPSPGDDLASNGSVVRIELQSDEPSPRRKYPSDADGRVPTLWGKKNHLWSTGSGQSIESTLNNDIMPK
ncbi:hypothetical protein DNTS_015936, partial [Danionella cerebrum]